MLLEVRNVDKTYGGSDFEVAALKGINLNVEQGECIAVMGKSGSGKSTLLHLIGCVDAPTKGEIYFEGEKINPSGEKEMAAFRRQKVGFVFQDFKLLPELSVYDNIVLPLVIDKLKIEEAHVTMLLERLGLTEKKDANVEKLSGGQKQRVAIARALIHDPQLLLCDEPTGALDTENAKQIMELLMQFHQDGKTIMLVTHDKTVAEYAQKTIYLKDGQISQAL